MFTLERALVGLLACIVDGCTERPVVPGEPTPLERLAMEGIAVHGASDVLLVVDDSISMGDKQRLFADALAKELQDVVCVNADGEVVPLRETSKGLSCYGIDPRIGMITTSLAAGGNAECDVGRGGHLVPLPNGEAFLDRGADREGLESWILSAGEAGCGYESTLEAMYRFLIEPRPLSEDGSGRLDEVLLSQRDMFLTPGSSLKIVFVTDEDDCSVLDTEAGTGMRSDSPRYRGSTACDSEPESACCRSCGRDEQEPPEGCVALSEDPNCLAGELEPELDDPNVRCIDQRRRFGDTYLFPVERYVRGLTSLTVVDSKGDEVSNPLFAGSRTPDLVHIAVLAGVPWNAVASEDDSEGDQLAILTPKELSASSAWERLVGDGSGRDPRMLESIEPRSQLPDPQAARWADPIISHEFDNPRRTTIQNSCVFELPEPLECTGETWCDCSEQIWSDGEKGLLSPNNPVCQAPDDTYGETQYFAKATPPLRLLSVAREVSALVGSICPKTLDPAKESTSAFGYDAFGTALRPWLAEGGIPEDTCVRSRWPDSVEDRARCKLIETVPRYLDCDLPGHRPAPEEYAIWTLGAGESLDEFTYCEVLPVPGDQEEEGTAAHDCAYERIPPAGEVGYCLIDPARGLGSEEFVEACPDKAKRRIRLVPHTLGREGLSQRVHSLNYVCL